jgi:hypothetical protein
MNFTTVNVLYVSIWSWDSVDFSLCVKLLLVILPRKNADSVAAFRNLVELLEEV